MRDPLCPPEDLPKWVPGQVILGSDGQGWRNVALRSYRYCGQDVIVPAMRDYMIVSYCTGEGIGSSNAFFWRVWRVRGGHASAG